MYVYIFSVSLLCISTTPSIKVVELVQTTVSRVLQLQKLLAKKQDPNTHLPYIAALAQVQYNLLCFFIAGYR